MKVIDGLEKQTNGGVGGSFLLSRNSPSKDAKSMNTHFQNQMQSSPLKAGDYLTGARTEDFQPMGPGNSAQLSKYKERASKYKQLYKQIQKTLLDER